MSLWSLRERPAAATRTSLEIGGALLLLLSWWGASAYFDLPKTLLPTPGDVLRAFPALFAGTNVPSTPLQAALPFLRYAGTNTVIWHRSEEHTSELQSQSNLVCRL